MVTNKKYFSKKQQNSENLILGKVDISTLLNAQQKFEQFRQHLTTEQERAGAVQAFEFCYELCWKTMKKILSVKGLLVNSPRDAFREAAKNGYIADPELWFEFLEKRNLTTHVYDENTMMEVIESFDLFSTAMMELLHNIKTTT